MVLRRFFWMLLLAGAGCAAGKQPHAMRVFAPICNNEPNLTPALSAQIATVDDTFAALDVSLAALDGPTTADFLQAVQAVQHGFFLLSYTGHGVREQSGPSQLCLRPAAAPKSCPELSRARDRFSWNECVLKTLPSSLSGATFIVDACQSAQVDPTLAGVPTSVISSSPYVVDADSLFGDRLALALRQAASDPNCDGLVTDQELFDALLANVSTEVSTAERRAYPKLRRNATSHLPLPIAPTRRSQCNGERERVRALAVRSDRELAAGIDAQLALDPLSPTHHPLPASAHDYFVLGPGCREPKAIRAAAREAGLIELPALDAKSAAKVAHFAIFTEIYQISSCDDWSRVTRLRDDALIAVEPTSTLALALPRRRTITDTPVRNLAYCQVRYTRTAPANGNPVHCAEPDGQCFLEPCSKGPR